VNPTSGKGKGARVAAAALPRLRAAGLDVTELRGTDSDHATELARAAVADGTDALVVIGGDGSVHLGLQAVAGTTTPLGILPAGTGNDAARVLCIPLDDPVAAAGIVAAGHVRAVDVARAGTRWFVGVLAAGFDARVNERANRMRRPRGRMRYNVAMVAELGVFRPIPYHLELDGEVWSADAMLVAVGNGPSYGGGMLVLDGAVIDDGLLDVLVLRKISRPELLRVFPKVYTGAHLEHPAVEVRRARRVTLAAPNIVAYADGERVAPLPLTVEVVPGGLRVLAPGAPPDPQPTQP
jgi:diacylglycerol kinase (ATP)